MIKVNTQIIVSFEGYPDEDNEITITSKIPEGNNKQSIDLYMDALDFAVKAVKDDFNESFKKIIKR